VPYAGPRRWRPTGWFAVILAPIAVPAALIAGIFEKPKRRSAQEVAAYLRDFIDGAGDEWDWDDFECVQIADGFLDRIRREAVAAGPPNPDIAKLRELLARVESRIVTPAGA